MLAAARTRWKQLLLGLTIDHFTNGLTWPFFG